MGNWAAAEALGQGQRGVITRAQLMECGIKQPAIKWALRSGRLVKMFARAYRFAVVTAAWEQRALAALLLAGQGSALSHSTAAAMWELNGFTAGADDPIHMTLPDRRKLDLPEDFVVHRPLGTFNPYQRSGFQVTRLARTIVDIAPTLTEERLEIVLDAAQQRHRALPRWLREEVSRYSAQSQPGLRRLVELLAVREGVATESPIETQVRRALRGRGLPSPRLQFKVFDASGYVMRVDFAWLQERVALHADSYEWHAQRQAFDRDAAQRSRLASLGWVSIMVTKTALRNDSWLRQLEVTLQARAAQKELFGSVVRGSHARRQPR